MLVECRLNSGKDRLGAALQIRDKTLNDVAIAAEMARFDQVTGSSVGGAVLLIEFVFGSGEYDDGDGAEAGMLL